MTDNINRQKQSTIQYIIALGAACLVFAVMQGVRDNYGIMLTGIIKNTGMAYGTVSTVIAVGQILYGATQPIFGMLAIRKSNAFVMLCGIVLMASGLIVAPFCTESWMLLIFLGILLPAGTGALCFGIVMGAVSPIIGEKKAAIAAGILQASAGVGDAIMSPTLQYLTANHGITFSMPVFSVPILAMIPIVIWLNLARKKSERDVQVSVDAEDKETKDSLFSILGSAVKDKTYWCLLIGFSTCGFHMSIIETHLFSQYISSGISGTIASIALTVYGITTMLGAILTGFLSQKFRMKNVLAGVYGIRIFIGLSFIMLPKTPMFAFVATAALGMTGDSTVPPTTGIISAKVGVAKMAVVYGSIFIGHQIGAFTSSWLGGVLVDTSIGYSGLWIFDMVLCTIAAIASFLIKDRC